MKNKKIIIAGGTGFIGEAMTNYFGKNNSIIILTRAETNNVNNRNHFHALSREVLENVRYIKWDGKTVDKWSEMLDGADMIINGRQMYSWVHITDTCRMIAWIESRPEITGAYNCCAPHPVTNEVFMSTLRKATGHKFGLPAPSWLLQLGAPLIGTETELVLKSRWMIPTKITATGFRFSFPHLEEALQDIIKSVPRKQYHLF
jgi:NAD dependent epimerase/dehydratase family enzyme